MKPLLGSWTSDWTSDRNCVTKRFHSHAPKSELHTGEGGGGGGAVEESLVGGVQPWPSNPDPV